MIDNRGGKYKNPRVFTEQGVAMLATIIHTQIATKISIQIMDAFVTMRKYISNSFIEQKFINDQVLKNTEDIKALQESFKKFDEKRVANEIFFDGQIYDAYSKILDIMLDAKEELIIIDNYADKTILDIVKNIKCQVVLISNSHNNFLKTIISKYNSQYSNLKAIYNNSFHDRYFIIDNQKVFHCGTSVNHAGSKTFSINLLEDDLVKKALMDNVSEIILQTNIR